MRFISSREVVDVAQDATHVVAVPDSQSGHAAAMVPECAPRQDAREGVRRDERAQFKLVDHDAGKVRQGLHESRIRIVRARVHRADGPDVVPVRRVQRRARIEADERLTDDEGIVGKAHVLPGIGNDERLAFPDGVSAERRPLWKLRGAETPA
jgi:hypothetical protein